MWAILLIVLLFVNIALQAMDVWTTVEVLSRGGEEQNVFSRFIMETLSIDAWVAIKVLLMAFLAGVIPWAWNADVKDNRNATLAALFAAVWMAFVVGGNLQVMGVI